jgi:hypothetical protein
MDYALKMGVYRHFKGNEYEVLGVGYDCDTTESIAILIYSAPL